MKFSLAQEKKRQRSEEYESNKSVRLNLSLTPGLVHSVVLPEEIKHVWINSMQ